jgi:hypothetical protein
MKTQISECEEKITKYISIEVQNTGTIKCWQECGSAKESVIAGGKQYNHLGRQDGNFFQS